MKPPPRKSRSINLISYLGHTLPKCPFIFTLKPALNNSENLILNDWFLFPKKNSLPNSSTMSSPQRNNSNQPNQPNTPRRLAHQGPPSLSRHLTPRKNPCLFWRMESWRIWRSLGHMYSPTGSQQKKTRKWWRYLPSLKRSQWVYPLENFQWLEDDSCPFFGGSGLFSEGELLVSGRVAERETTCRRTWWWRGGRQWINSTYWKKIGLKQKSYCR